MLLRIWNWRKRVMSKTKNGGGKEGLRTVVGGVVFNRVS